MSSAKRAIANVMAHPAKKNGNDVAL